MKTPGRVWKTILEPRRSIYGLMYRATSNGFRVNLQVKSAEGGSWRTVAMVSRCEFDLQEFDRDGDSPVRLGKFILSQRRPQQRREGRYHSI